ncbi:caffeoylshikimate esterase [Nymphaea colorata]|uniref:Serine aminopeptidase S33 domain-containing protein n=1 Tax=Nymphaea colorata TaxID=210225 RepID=A0A5K1E2B1_9MAGN|nr:caffeoylshikimate esterase [Nymphaea colorata]
MGSTPTAEDSGTPANFWGDMPEEEYYASQGVKHTQSYFSTPNGTIFTQSWLPSSASVHAILCMTHGYSEDTSWVFQKTAMFFARCGYAVFGADLLGHGRSDGLRGYVGDLSKTASSSLLFFQSVRDSPSFRGLPAFLYGASMGGAATMLMYFQDPDGWSGLIFCAPLFIMPEKMKPSRLRLFLFGLLLGLADTWAAMPALNMIGSVKDHEKLKIMVANPRRYAGPPRVGTMRELSRVCDYIQANFDKVRAPFLTLHGTADGITAPESSTLLYEKAASEDKSVKLYEGMYHALIEGEPEENSTKVLADIREWLDARAKTGLGRVLD